MLAAFWVRLQVAHPTAAQMVLVPLAVAGTTLFVGLLVLHELAHGLIAVWRGVAVEVITLRLSGGATLAEPSDPSALDELVVALAGPLANLLLAAVLGASTSVIANGGHADALLDVLNWTVTLNLLLAAFNLVPGLPLDGGRVGRSVVWAVTGDFARATRWINRCGLAMAVSMLIAGSVAIWHGRSVGVALMVIGANVGLDGHCEQR